MKFNIDFKKKENLFYLLLICLPFIDLITALQTRFIDFSITLGILVKGILLLIIVYYLFFKCKTKYKKISCIYIILYVLFGIIYLLTKLDGNSLGGLFSECINLFKFGFYPILVIGLLNLVLEKYIDLKKISCILSFSFAVYAFFILLPYITGTGFKSYELLDITNGTTGWFFAANEIGCILVLLFTFVYRLVDQKKYVLFLIIACVGEYMAFMIGTKVASLGMLIVGFIMLIYYMVYKGEDKLKKVLLVLLVFIVGIASFQIGPTENNVGDTYSRYENNKDKDDLSDIDIDYSNRLVNFAVSLLSGREVFAIRVSRVYVAAPITDKLFGIGFNYRPSLETKHAARLVEMDSLDIVFRFGIIGTILLFLPLMYILINILINFIKKKYHPSMRFFRYFLIWGMIVSIGFIAGHVLGAPAVSFYLAIVTVMMCKAAKDGGSKNEDIDSNANI